MCEIKVVQITAKRWEVQINGAVVFSTFKGRGAALKHAELCVNRAKGMKIDATVQIIPL